MAGVSRRGDGDVWEHLRGLTPARIGLGRAGSSLPTTALLDFELAHARARDAVHAEFDSDALAREICNTGLAKPLIVASRARDRMEYLLRPDLGRRLDEAGREVVRAAKARDHQIVFVVADGLSAVAPARHAVPLLKELFQPTSAKTGQMWGTQTQAPGNVTVVVANRARVALGDEIGELLEAEAVVVLIGERPGLSSPDSLGIYMTWAPRLGRSDAERNCISNVRPEGLPYAEGARRLAYLLSEARRLQLSGVALKDDSQDRHELTAADGNRFG